MWIIAQILLALLAIGYGYAVFQILKTQHRMFNKDLEAIRHPPMPVFSTVPCGARYDAISWNPIACYIGGALFVPIRLISVLVIISGGCVVVTITRLLFGKETKAKKQTPKTLNTPNTLNTPSPDSGDKKPSEKPKKPKGSPELYFVSNQILA